MKKFWFIAGAAIGFVLGARAGRSRYERIRAGAADVWESDPVQRVADKAVSAVEDRVPAVGEALADSKGAIDDAAGAVPRPDSD